MRQSQAVTRTGTSRIGLREVLYEHAVGDTVIEAVVGAVGIYAGSFAVAVISGILPVVNAELYLIGLVFATTPGVPEVLLLATMIAAGQMVGKGALFQTARGTTHLVWVRRPALAARLDRARARVERWRTKPYSLLFVAATVGLPPLYLVTLVAGVLDIPFRAFLLVGLAGRTLRFGTIGVLAALA